jgi:hypothetical protein
MRLTDLYCALLERMVADRCTLSRPALISSRRLTCCSTGRSTTKRAHEPVAPPVLADLDLLLGQRWRLIHRSAIYRICAHGSVPLGNWR